MNTLLIKGVKYFILLIASILLSACGEEQDSRIYEPAKIVAAYVNGELISTNNLSTVNEHAIVTLPPGTDLSKLKVRLTVINGELIDFPTDVETDFRLPRPVRIRSYNDMEETHTFQIVSKPLLLDFYIEGMTVSREQMFIGENSIIVQVPAGTDFSALKVTMGFKNGELSGFTNDTALDYANPIPFNVIGVDGTVYPYELIITDQEVGPASIQNVIANDAQVETIEVDEATGNVQLYFKTLTNFAAASLTITTGYGNAFVDFTNGTVVNLWNAPVVKIKGTDGITKEFKFLKPKLELAENFRKTPTDLGFGADGGSALCFSGEYIVAATHNGTAGIHYFDLTGTKVGSLTLPSTVNMGNAVTGLRKIASDDNGAIVGINLAAGGAVGTAYNIYKWNSVTDQNPVVLCSFTASALGLTATRTNGINVQGSLNGNAVITVPITTSKVVLKWTFEGGNLVNATPEKISLDGNESNFGNYSSVEQYPGKPNTLVAGLAITGFGGIRSYVGGATAISVATTANSTDLRMKVIDGRTYLAHTVWGNARHTFHFKDITDDNEAAYRYNMLWDGAFVATTSNGNATVDADFALINGHWYVAYLGTNGGIVCYTLK
jgi:hypothetical protein